MIKLGYNCNFLLHNFIYFCCCMGFSQVVVSKGYSLGAVHRLPPAVAFLIAEHGLLGDGLQ